MAAADDAAAAERETTPIGARRRRRRHVTHETRSIRLTYEFMKEKNTPNSVEKLGNTHREKKLGTAPEWREEAQSARIDRPRYVKKSWLNKKKTR